METSNQSRLAEILKKKGIGPEGSKSLKPEEIEDVKFLFNKQDVSLTTKATLLTALLTLETNPTEKSFLEEIRNDPSYFLPLELVTFITGVTKSTFERIVLKVISNKDLEESESRFAMDSFFNFEEPDYLKASFLEAERLKRETFLENSAFFHSLWNRVDRTKIDLPILIDIADSYDGCNRTRHLSVFVGSLLASVGFPTYLTGIERVAPKEAITTHQILKAANKNPLNSIDRVIKELRDPDIRWGYIDQQIFFPQLFAMKEMRKEMVKRPFLATFEKLLQPIQSNRGNLIVTGYTHTHYREELVKQLQEQNECREAIVLKGIEGSTQISMSRDTVVVHYDGSSINDGLVNPNEFGLPQYNITRDLSITANACLAEGIEALKGKEGFAKDNIIYTASIILTKFKLMKKEEIVSLLNESIKKGNALKHWQRGCEY